MFWARLGSLNALETLSAARFWRRWVRRELCSLDTIGRIQADVNCQDLRRALHRVYERLKRNKALPLNLVRDLAVLDGHESHASYWRHCTGCLQRKVETNHRNVTLMLLPKPLPGQAPLRLLLDAGS